MFLNILSGRLTHEMVSEGKHEKSCLRCISYVLKFNLLHMFVSGDNTDVNDVLFAGDDEAAALGEL